MRQQPLSWSEYERREQRMRQVAKRRERRAWWADRWGELVAVAGIISMAAVVYAFVVAIR